MNNIKSFKLYESSLVDRKIEILHDICIFLIDENLSIKIEKNSKYIILKVNDYDNLFELLYKSSIIKEFDRKLNLFGFNYRTRSGGENHMEYSFDKWSNMTNSPLLKNYI